METYNIAHNFMYSLRYLLLLSSNTILFTWLVLRLLPDKRFPRLWIAYTATVILYRVIFIGILPDYFAATPTRQIIYFLVALLFALIFNPMALLCFRDNWCKIVIYSSLSDITTALIGFPLTCLLAILEGRSNITLVTGSLMPVDFLYPVVIFGVYLLISRKGKRLLDRLAALSFQKRRQLQVLAGVFLISVPVFSVSTPWQTQHKTLFAMMRLLALLLLVTGGLLASLGVHLYRLHAAQVEQEHIFLKNQSQFMSLYREEILEQIRRMNENQRLVDAQMTDLMSREWNADSVPRIRKYLDHLKEQYESIRAGVYCDNWTVDAVLCYMAKKADSRGIPCEFQVNLPGETIPSGASRAAASGEPDTGEKIPENALSGETLAELLFRLLNDTIPAAAAGLSLHADPVKGRLMLDLSLTAAADGRFLTVKNAKEQKKFEKRLAEKIAPLLSARGDHIHFMTDQKLYHILIRC